MIEENLSLIGQKENNIAEKSVALGHETHNSLKITIKSATEKTKYEDPKPRANVRLY